MSEQATELLGSAEEEEIKARSTQVRFRQQLLLGTGGAMIFGLVGALSSGFLGSLGTLYAAEGIAAALFSLPALGLVGVAALGLSCIYLGTKYFAEAISLDQDSQARKNALAKVKIEGMELAPAQEVTVSRPMGTPFGVAHTHDEAAREIQPAPENRRTAAPSHTISHVAHHEKMDAKEILTSHAAPEASWASRAAANDTATIHPEQAGRA